MNAFSSLCPPSQGHSHPPATRELLSRSVLHLWSERQTSQDPTSFSLCCVCSNRPQILINLWMTHTELSSTTPWISVFRGPQRAALCWPCRVSQTRCRLLYPADSVAAVPPPGASVCVCRPSAPPELQECRPPPPLNNDKERSQGSVQLCLLYHIISCTK